MAQTFGQILQAINNTETRIALELLFGILGLDSNSKVGDVLDHLSYVPGITYDKTHSPPQIQSIQFDIEHDATPNEGEIVYDSSDGTIALGMPGGEVTLQLGQEHLIRVFNATGSDIANGSLVYISSAGDQKPRIALADADNTNSIPEAVVVGMATELIEKSSQGYITSVGLVRGLNTNDLVEGDPVWLSTTPGAFTKTKPTAPNRSIFIGHCIYKHSSNGIILVNINPIPPLLGLSDVLAANPNDGDILVWSEANSRWQIQSP
jgi:hypothetical protein